ncbi:3'(2'),5'-bisphosphate nucleotidase CysQ [secondary endosymbiont of Ctenarytaina eucalypti]|uniref:3'(2'),5'-bisphosphate nucleotidase CysQ n=1 Tax=secondary endosymbiont of Ctenarytaina eucalypti TaxID=1199245 RepID=J3VTB7_9ENTR|nr:3'(2'),5'-bisphosphate nucleotidase CysQ [secondary endosymbiont of Ctenarytaina eucalypti]AFP85211.1 3'(2'),5'-bisphosphate nucleotidase [secondary endosymbiont of Ctenarytaina eucalypti]
MIEKIITLSRDAGAAIMQVYNSQRSLESSQKEDNSPVTAADLAAHKVIAAGLQMLSPDIPLLSEEDPPDWSVRQHWRHFWLVDPLDGTKEFLRRTGEFTVNIALIEDGKPLMGVVYAPITNRLYAAVDGNAWSIKEHRKPKPIKVKAAHPPLVVLSRSHGNNAELRNYLVQLGEHQTLMIGSSLKFCLVAEGAAQLYPRFGPTNIWDTAAGHAVASAAGAQVNDWEGRTLDYTPRESFLNPAFRVSLF